MYNTASDFLVTAERGSGKPMATKVATSFADFDELFIDSATHQRRVLCASKRKLDDISSLSTTNPHLSSICTTINTITVSILTQESVTSEIRTIPSGNKFIAPKKKQRRKTAV